MIFIYLEFKLKSPSQNHFPKFPLKVNMLDICNTNNIKSIIHHDINIHVGDQSIQMGR